MMVVGNSRSLLPGLILGVKFIQVEPQPPSLSLHHPPHPRTIAASQGIWRPISPAVWLETSQSGPRGTRDGAIHL